MLGCRGKPLRCRGMDAALLSQRLDPRKSAGQSWAATQLLTRFVMPSEAILAGGSNRR